MRTYKGICIGPIFERAMSSGEHPEGEVTELGDKYGRDCQIAAFENGFEKGFVKLYRNDGSRNEDWYTHNATVLAPVNGTVTLVNVNEIENEVGIMAKVPSGHVIIETEDGVNLVLAHLKEITIKAGDAVAEGQSIAKAGNNGCSRSPHVHVGAYKGEDPYQIQFDLVKIGAVIKRVGEEFFYTGINRKEGDDQHEPA